MEVRRLRVVQLPDEFLGRRLLLGRALQLEQHMIHGQRICHRSGIGGGPDLGPRVPGEAVETGLVDRFADQRTAQGLRSERERRG
jgi:hypothetical protein